MSNYIQKHIKKILHHDQLSFIPGKQGWVNIHESINVMHYVSKIENKNHVIISIDAKKTFNKIQHPFILQKVGEATDQRKLPHHHKGHYDKPKANIIPKGEKQKGLPLNLGTRKSYPLPPLLFIILL